MASLQGAALRGLRRALAPLQLRGLASLSGGSFDSLPVIDIAALRRPGASEEEKRAVGRALHDACRNVGFFYASGHGLPPELTAGVMAEARRWFALPEAEKARVALSPATHYRGWQRLGANVTQGRRDLHEGLDLYKEVDPAVVAAAGQPASPLHGANPWPAAPAFTRQLRAYVDGCLGLGAALLRGIALGLQLPEDYFGGELAGDSYWVLRVLHYPPLQPGGGGGAPAADGEEISCGEHTDYGLLTLVFQEPGVTALQVRDAAGGWVDAPPLPGTFVCNIGDMFRVITNGQYTPTAHRVVNRSGRDRVSIPFFYETNFDARVAPHPQFGAPQFEPVRYGAHLESKVLSNFDFS